MFEFNYRKAVQMLNFFAIKEGGNINKMKAIKLIWLSDRAHLRRYCRAISMDQYFAMKNGPVPSNIKDLVDNNEYLDDTEKIYRNKFIETIDNIFYKSINTFDNKVFSDSDLQIMEKIYNEFGMYDAIKLSEISHKFPEWKKFENRIKSNMSSRYPMEYNDFFENPNENKFKIFTESQELIDLSKEFYLENLGIYNELTQC